MLTTKRSKSVWQLNVLNFFIADVQAGIGPFLGIFLLARGWQPHEVGTVLTIGGIAGMLVTAPAGAMVDASVHKKWYVVVPGFCTILASFALLASPAFWVVSLSQVATAVAGAVIGPAIIGITLGMVRQEGFNRQNGLNQVYNHAGNLAGAALSGLLAMRYGLPAVCWLAVAFGVMSVIVTCLIPRHAIDDQVARGLPSGTEQTTKAEGAGVLLRNKSLLVLAACLACFHLGNAAMLPLYGMAAATRHAGDPAWFVAMTIMIAQLVMMATSAFAMQAAPRFGYWWILLVSFLALPLRGYIAAHLVSQAGLYPVQVLDGIGAGLQSVAVPGLVARMLEGSGRINAGQGAIMTVLGLGAALSPALGGWLVKYAGYGHAFLVLGSLAGISVVLWILYRRHLNNCCAAEKKASWLPAAESPGKPIPKV